MIEDVKEAIGKAKEFFFPTNSGRDFDDRIWAVLDEDTSDFSKLAAIAGLDITKIFRYADLSNIDFSDQDLNGFDFTGANLSGCKFYNAVIDQTIFEGANLSGVEGLRNSNDQPVLLVDPVDADDLYEHPDWNIDGGSISSSMGSHYSLMMNYPEMKSEIVD